MNGYTKLFARILDSTIWWEDDRTRILWITMLAMADRDGIVRASIPGLANRARISVEDCESALARFQQPDKYSTSQDDEGRRIKVCDGAWLLINHSKYRALMSAEDQREKARIRQQNKRTRDKESDMSRGVTSGHECHDIAKAKADTKAKQKHTSTLALTRKRERVKSADHIAETIYAIYPRKEGRGGAYRAIEKALVRVSKEESCSREDAGDFIYAAVTKFSESPAGKKGQYTPHCATWMNQDRFFDDPEAWWRVNANGNGNGNGREQSDAIREVVEQLALAGNGFSRE